MVPTLMQMSPWSPQVEEELGLLLKDWLKQHGRTQADLRHSLKAASSRMPALLEVLKQEFSQGGLPNIASRLCKIEEAWSSNNPINSEGIQIADPFGQLDLLLEEIREDCEN